MKKFLFGIATFLMMAVLCVVSAGAETYSYSVLDDGTVEIVYYEGSATELDIPSEIDGKSVTKIGVSAFYDCTNLTSVTIPDSVTSIGDSAFSHCSSLTSVTIPDSVTSIGSCTFSGCASLTSVTIPDGVTSIDESAFYDCTNLTLVIIPDGVTSIGDSAFSDCSSLTSVTIPDSVTSIGKNAFGGCTSLTSVNIPDGVICIEAWTFSDCSSLTSVTIPDSVTSIGENAFGGCSSLTSVTISDSVSSIGDYAFGGCSSLTSVNIPDSVTNIGDYAFYCCESLTSINIPDSVTNIGDYAFYCCESLTSINIPDSVTSIGVEAFNYLTVYCNEGSCAEQYATDNALTYCYTSSTGYCYDVTDNGTAEITGYIGAATALQFPSTVNGRSVTSIGSCAFYDYTFLTSATIPDSIKNIGDCAFYNCTSLKSVTIGNGVTNIAYYVFGDCTSLTSVTIPDSVTNIGDSAFDGCTSLVTITIPDSVTNIGDCAFDGCTSLVTITIPDSVISIGFSAFNGCNSLKSVSITDSVKRIGRYAFDNTALVNNQTTHVKYLGEWVIGCDDTESAIIKDGIKNISDGAFEFCTTLTSINIPDGITNIGIWAFGYCFSLEVVTIPESVTKINNSAFYNCPSLKSIEVDSDNKYYTSVDGILFDKNKTTLFKYPAGKENTSYIIPDNVTTICDNAFDYCSSITSITIADNVTSIGANAFYNCSSLKSITIPNNIVNIGECAFFGCPLITTITIPDNVKSIGRFAFGFYSNGPICLPIDNFNINCYKDTAGEKYAIDNEFDYNLLSKVTAPTAMKNFKLGGRAADALRLNWTKNDTADGYIIEQYKSGKWTRVAKITSNATTTYRVTGLAAGTVYKFRMKAYKMDGTTALYSSYTSTLSARTNPSKVAGFKLGGRAADALRLNWTKNTSADGYIVEQYKSGKWVRIAKITSNATTTYKITGLKASTQYKFRVRAYKMSGKTALYSGYTSTLSAYTNPSKVANLKITGKATTALRLGWSKNTSADGYIVEMYKDGKWVRAAKITSNATITFRKAGLKKGTTYKFRVKAYNMVGKTALYGNYVSVSGTTNK